MALEIKVQACEGCEEFTFSDVTGPYSATSNLTGYGPANGVASPEDFDSYTLKVWFPGTSLSDDPDYEYDLLANLPTPDSSGFYDWIITEAMLDVDPIVSGVYTMTAVGVIGQLTYAADTQVIFVKDIKSKVDAAMSTYDPTCGCADGCEDPTLLYTQYVTVACCGICDASKSQALIADLYERSRNCC